MEGASAPDSTVELSPQDYPTPDSFHARKKLLSSKIFEDSLKYAFRLNPQFINLKSL